MTASLRGAQEGFTLIELMIVVAIIALAAGLGIGFFESGEDDGLKAANSILAAAASAHSQARLDKKPVVLTLKENAVVLPAEGTGRSKPFPAGVSLISVETTHEKSNEGDIVFQPRGVTKATRVSLRYGTAVYSIYIPSIGAGKVFAEETTLEQMLKEYR